MTAYLLPPFLLLEPALYLLPCSGTRPGEGSPRPNSTIRELRSEASPTPTNNLFYLYTNFRFSFALAH